MTFGKVTMILTKSYRGESKALNKYLREPEKTKALYSKWGDSQMTKWLFFTR